MVATPQQVIDKVIAIVGRSPVLLSDLETHHIQKMKDEPEADKCETMEDLIYQKLLLAQADRDSVTVADAEVDAEISKRLAYYIQMFGSEEKFEQYYGKRTNVFKDEIRNDVHDQILAQKMQQKVMGDVKLTPSEVRAFYNSIPVDSLPIINTELQIGQIVRMPPVSAEAKKEARERLESYRQRVIKGESMSVLAALYTEDPGSSKSGGLYENISRGMFVPEFDAVMFRLKNGEISEIFETPFGYHFIQLVARKGEVVDLRHILISPKITQLDMFEAKNDLDSIQQLIVNKQITFEDAARRWSDDKETKQNGGLMVNPQTGTTKWTVEEIGQVDQNLVFLFDKMNVGEVTPPVEYRSPDSKVGYRILTIISRTDPHRANLKDDYAKLLQMATLEKQKERMGDWIAKRSKTTYIKIDPSYVCKFEHKWVITN
jgi:peptidyl-prolyl cis-trans isomerase SurA